MVRTLILHSSKAFAIFALSLFASNAALAGDMTGESVVGQVSGYRAVFPTPSVNLLVAKKLSATLELTFQTSSQFSAEQVSVVSNGLQCTATANRIRSLAEWKNEGGTRVLVLEMDTLRFGNQVAFLDKVRDVVSHHGSLTLDVRAPFALKTAKLSFTYEMPPPPHSTVQLTKVEPAGPVVFSRNLTFTFASPEGAKYFECRESRRSHQWMPCSSPKVFTELANGRHHFRFRAVDKLGRVGPITRYRVYVDAPSPAVILTSIVPKEDPTTSTTMQIAFQLNGSGGSHVECHLDNLAWARCSSPVLFKNLSDGAHKATFRRTNWIYDTFLGKWLGHYAWFHWICPRYFDPVVYAWVVQRGIPSAELVSTPKALTKESLARFEFRSDVAAQFRCQIDGGAAVECVSPFELTVTEGFHLFEVIPYVGAAVGRPVSYRWEVDQSAPELTLGTVIPAEVLTSSSTLSFGFTSSEEATFRCSLDGAPASACDTPVIVTGLNDGAHEVTVVAVDEAGNQGEELVYEWTVDRQAPGAKAQMTFPASVPTKETRAVFEFSTNESATFRCAVDGLDRGACVSPFEVTDLGEGQHEFSVTPVDAVGNVGVAATIQWTVDLTLPSVRVTAIEPPESATEMHDIRLDFEVSEPASVLCELDGGGQLPCRSPYLASNLADGNHEVTILAIDAAQNVSRTQRHVWRVDSVALAQISSVAPDGAVVNSRSMQVEFGSTNASSFVCSLDGAAVAACASPVQYASLADGPHTFAVYGLNLSGSIGPAAEHSWVIDTAGPVVALDSVDPSTTPTASKKLAIAFSSADAASFFCTLDTAAETVCVSPVALSEVSEGAHRFSIVGVDSLGNRGNPAVHEWTVDVTGPAVAFGNVTPSGAVVASLTLTADLVANEPVTFLCALDGGAEAACVSPHQVEVVEGQHTLVLVGIDALGNRGTPALYQWGVLMPEAMAQIDAFSPESTPTTSQTASVTFSGPDVVSFVCRLDSAAFSPCASGVSYQNVAEGSHTFSVAGLNLAHRQGPAVSRTWVIDRTGPVVQILSTNPFTSPTSALSLTAYFSASETATFRCQLDDAGETECVPPFTALVGEGRHRLAISGIDALGNRGTAAVHQWIVSVPEASVALTSVVPSAAITQSRAFTAGFIGTDAVSFECRLDGAAFTACASPFLTTGLVDGAHTFEVRGVNAVGRTGAAQSHGWTVDNAGPSVSVTSVVPALSLTASRQLAVHFSADEAGATFACALDGGAAVACTSPAVFSDLTDGSHQVSLTAFDALGNVGPSASHTWIVDATGPVTTFGSIVPATATTSSLTLTASFSANETATFMCSLDGASEVSCSSPRVVTVGEGNHTLAVAGTDALGNRGATVVHSWTVSVPEVFAQIDAFMPSQSPVASRNAFVSFSGAGAASFRCSLDGAAFATCASAQNYSNLADGAHSFAVVAVNTVGQVGAPAARAWTVDTTGPVTHLDSTSPAASPTSSPTLSAAFSANEIADFRCSLDGATEAACSSPHTVNVGEGAHTLSIAATDALGNRGNAVTYFWTVAIPPATVTLQSTTPSATLTNATTFSAQFTGVEAVSFECRLDNAAFAACASPFSVSGLGNGAHLFQVRGVNGAGPGTAASHSWTIDTVGPNTTLLSVTPDWSPTSNNTLTASFAASESGATFACRLDSGAEVACSSPYTFTGLVDGTHHISIAALDSLGNRGLAVTHDWIVDSTALNISNVSVTNVTSNSARIEWSTNFVSNSQVKYGTGANLNQTSSLNATNVTTHSVVLTGLSSFTFYSAQAVSVDRDGRTVQSTVVTFRTLRP